MAPHAQNRVFTPGRVLVIILAIVTLWRVWLPAPQLPAAYGQIPDSGMQRQQILEEVRRTNQLLSEFLQVAQRHTFKVRIEGTDNKAAPRSTGSGR